MIPFFFVWVTNLKGAVKHNRFEFDGCLAHLLIALNFHLVLKRTAGSLFQKEIFGSLLGMKGGGVGLYKLRAKISSKVIYIHLTGFSRL